MITLLHQLKVRAAKIQQWMAKYNVRSLLRKWALELTKLEGQIEQLELAAVRVPVQVPVQLSFDFSAPPQPQPPRQTMRYEVRTGSEWHSTERRGAMVEVNGRPIYKVLKPACQEWLDVGNKGKHGKWCVAEYEIPVGSLVKFTATANGRPPIVAEFVVGEVGSKDIDVEGYKYGAGDRICGWIVCLEE